MFQRTVFLRYKNSSGQSPDSAQLGAVGSHEELVLCTRKAPQGHKPDFRIDRGVLVQTQGGGGGHSDRHLDLVALASETTAFVCLCLD